MRITTLRVQIAILLILAACVGVISTPIMMRSTMERYMYESVADVPETDVALVLGAAVRRGQPTPVLAERADRAIQLYKAGKVRKILVTGDNGALSHDEVTPVKNYLLEAGVAAGDIFLDHAGFDTYSSMYRARDVFGADSMTVVTQDFHLPRALYIARHLGLSAYGVAARSAGVSFKNYIREIPASVKALIDLVVGRTPKYLGDPIPLDGDGSTTWY